MRLRASSQPTWPFEPMRRMRGLFTIQLLLRKDLCGGKRRALRIFRRYLRRAFERPADAQRRVVPAYAPLVLRRPIIGSLIEKFGTLREHHESVRKAGRNPHMALVFGGEVIAGPLPEGGRRAPQIDGNIEYLARYHPYQLPLRLTYLVMQSAQHALA